MTAAPKTAQINHSVSSGRQGRQPRGWPDRRAGKDPRATASRQRRGVPPAFFPPEGGRGRSWPSRRSGYRGQGASRRRYTAAVARPATITPVRGGKGHPLVGAVWARNAWFGAGRRRPGAGYPHRISVRIVTLWASGRAAGHGSRGRKISAAIPLRRQGRAECCEVSVQRRMRAGLEGDRAIGGGTHPAAVHDDNTQARKEFSEDDPDFRLCPWGTRDEGRGP